MKVFSSGYSYRKDGRLADVIALIQVLALHPTETHRRDESIFRELCRKPISCDSWYHLALNHPEFFRVVPWPDDDYKAVPGIPPIRDGENVRTEAVMEKEANWPISLLARHLAVRDKSTNKIGALKITDIQPLLKLALDIHDQQEKQVAKWFTILGVISAASIGAFGAFWIRGDTLNPNNPSKSIVCIVHPAGKGQSQPLISCSNSK